MQDGRASEELVVGKGGKDRVAFFDVRALEAIRAYLAARGATFPPYIAVCLRHLRARVLPNGAAQLSEVQDTLGHASPGTTKKLYSQ